MIVDAFSWLKPQNSSMYYALQLEGWEEAVDNLQILIFCKVDIAVMVGPANLYSRMVLSVLN